MNHIRIHLVAALELYQQNVHVLVRT